MPSPNQQNSEATVGVEVPEKQKAWFESLPEEAQKAARRAELDTNLPVLALIMQEVGVPGVCAWAAYLDVMESGNVDPFDMPEILAAALPHIAAAIRTEERGKVLGEVRAALTRADDLARALLTQLDGELEERLDDEFPDYDSRSSLYNRAHDLRDELGTLPHSKGTLLATPDSLDRGGEADESQREYRVNAHDGIYGPFPDAQAALLELGEHQATHDEHGGPRPPELESRSVGPWEKGRWGQPDDAPRCARCLKPMVDGDPEGQPYFVCINPDCTDQPAPKEEEVR